MWQPITTAPRDASVVDIWCEYYDDEGERYEAERRTDCHFVASVGHWFDKGIQLGGGYTDIRVTHWMPLPPPPNP